MIEVRIEDLTFHAIIGLLDHERRTPQKVIVSASFTFDEGHFLDYAQAKEIIKKEIQLGKFLLLEEALESLIQRLYELYPFMKELQMTIKKPQILPDCIPSVTIKRKFI